MRAKWLLLGVLATSWFGSCSGGIGLRCEDQTRYTDHGENPPVHIPDDLSTPDQSESLRIPAPIAGDVEQVHARGPCLESPPDFYEAGAPG